MNMKPEDRIEPFDPGYFTFLGHNRNIDIEPDSRGTRPRTERQHQGITIDAVLPNPHADDPVFFVVNLGRFGEHDFHSQGLRSLRGRQRQVVAVEHDDIFDEHRAKKVPGNPWFQLPCIFRFEPCGLETRQPGDSFALGFQFGNFRFCKRQLYVRHGLKL